MRKVVSARGQGGRERGENSLQSLNTYIYEINTSCYAGSKSLRGIVRMSSNGSAP